MMKTYLVNAVDPLYSLLGFMTILPVAGRGFDLRAMLPYFPVVGLIIGAMLAAVDAVLGPVLPLPALAAVETVFLVMVTGALHLDGVADTADGLYAHRTPERSLDIMKDSRVGAMGVTAVVCTVLVKFAGLSSIDAGRAWVLLLVPALARGSVLIAVHQLPYGRTEEGLAAGLYRHPLAGRDLVGLTVVALLCLLLGWRGLWLLLVYAAVIFAMTVYYQKRLGCITGDMMGAMIEASEAVLLIAAAIGGGS